MPDSPVKLPAGYAPAFAVGYTDESGNLVLAGPFAPVAGRSVTLALSGTWEGTIQLTRSTDEGATRLPLTAGGLPWGSYTANICEQAWFESEDGAELYLEITLASGEVEYRIAQ